MKQRSLCFELLKAKIAKRLDISPGLLLKESIHVRLIRESYSPELPASVGNVSEITVAGLMGVNTVADGERPRPAQQKGYGTGKKILADSRPTELFCGAQSLL